MTKRPRKEFTLKKGPKFDEYINREVKGIVSISLLPCDPEKQHLHILNEEIFNDEIIARSFVSLLYEEYGREVFIENNSMTKENRWFYYTRMGRIFPTKIMIRELLPLGKNDE